MISILRESGGETTKFPDKILRGLRLSGPEHPNNCIPAHSALGVRCDGAYRFVPNAVKPTDTPFNDCYLALNNEQHRTASEDIKARLLDKLSGLEAEDEDIVALDKDCSAQCLKGISVQDFSKIQFTEKYENTP